VKQVIIVGGGTAGWLTALFANKLLAEVEITVIDSSEVAPIGVGEGTLPHFLSVLEMLDIPMMKVVEECDGTTKHGIKFTNWHGDDTSYFHLFISDNETWTNPCNIRDSYIPLNFLEALNRDMNISETCFQHILCNENKNPFVLDKQDGGLKVVDDFALHFNAKLLGVLLRKIAISRGVRVVDSEVTKVSVEENKVTQLQAGNHTFSPDIVYDCTGLHKVIISKLDTEWKAYSDFPTVNTAIPFVINHTDSVLPPYTESIAMKYGWVWKIPTQERFGCGYTFNSTYCSVEEAKEEILQQFPEAKIPGRVIEFSPGHYVEPWKGNCIAIGLSAGFIEPLEATSIFTTTLSIIESMIMPNLLFRLHPTYINSFNKKWVEVTEEIRDFVYLHYLTDRADTPYWINFSQYNAPKGLREDLDKWKDYPIGTIDVLTRIFNLSSWYEVMQGLRKLDTDVYKELYHSMVYNKKYVSKVFDEDIEFKKNYSQEFFYNSYVRE